MLAVSLYQVISLRVRLSKVTTQLIQSKADALALSTKLGEALAEKSLSENGDFVKFLSTSRDWAFQYIEEVQAKILSLANAMDNNNSDEIDEAYKDLISMIPDQKENK